jgi:hypothetical protein
VVIYTGSVCQTTVQTEFFLLRRRFSFRDLRSRCLFAGDLYLGENRVVRDRQIVLALPENAPQYVFKAAVTGTWQPECELSKRSQWRQPVTGEHWRSRDLPFLRLAGRSFPPVEFIVIKLELAVG